MTRPVRSADEVSVGKPRMAARRAHVEQAADPRAMLIDDVRQGAGHLGEVRECQQPDIVAAEPHEPADKQAVGVGEVRESADVVDEVQAEELTVAKRR